MRKNTLTRRIKLWLRGPDALGIACLFMLLGSALALISDRAPGHWFTFPTGIAMLSAAAAIILAALTWARGTAE